MPNSPLPPVTIQQWLKQAEKALYPITTAAQQDAACLLMHCLEQPYTYLITHHQDPLTTTQQTQATALLNKALAGEPIAYLLGHTEFYGLSLEVNPHVLIPRSATECLVDWVLAHYPNHPLHIADCGTGSGAIACALAHHRNQWMITAIDCCEDALQVAKKNFSRLGLTQQVTCKHNHWLDGIETNVYDIIISNPPYIDHLDPDIDASVAQFEPAKALFSTQAGLHDIALLIKQSRVCLKPQGLLVMEHGHQQQAQVMHLLKQAGFRNIEGHQDLSNHARFVTANSVISS